MTTRRKPGRPLDFVNAVQPDGKIDPTQWQQFLEFIGGQPEGGGTTTVVSRSIGAGVVTGGSSPPINENPSSGANTPLYNQFVTLNVPTGDLSVKAGQFVNYTATTGSPVMQLADCRNVGTFATHFVASIQGGVAQLAPVWSSGIVRFFTGRNLSDGAILYLYRDGTATDLRSDIVDSRNRPQPGVVWDQVLGYRIERKGNETARCSVSINAPRGPLG